MFKIETERLILREWSEEDILPFSKMGQDPLVMEFFLDLLSDEESKKLVEKFQMKMKRDGFCLLACVIKETEEFIGFVGINKPEFEAHFMPCVEIGWRLKSQAWGKGYAVEAANAILNDAFNRLNLNEVVAFAVWNNYKSIKVMEKIGMKRDSNGDFNHSKIPIDHPLSRHILYRITKEQFNQARSNLL